METRGLPAAVLARQSKIVPERLEVLMRGSGGEVRLSEIARLAAALHLEPFQLAIWTDSGAELVASTDALQAVAPVIRAAKGAANDNQEARSC